MSSEQENNNNDTVILKEYADIKKQIKELTVQAKKREKQVFEFLEKNETSKIKTNIGTFSITERVKFEYPEEIINLEEAYKKEISSQKGLYEQKDDAIKTIIKILNFRA